MSIDHSKSVTGILLMGVSKKPIPHEQTCGIDCFLIILDPQDKNMQSQERQKEE